MLTLPRRTALLGSLFLLAFQPAADKVEFRPAEGAELAKTFTMGGNFEVGDMTMVVDGQDMSGSIPLDAASGEFKMGFEVADTYVKTVDGRLVEFTREFVKSTSEVDMGEQSESEDNWMKLDGETVKFTWNAETKSYDAVYADGEGDAEVLENLKMNPELLDYRPLLPTKAVEKGDRWTVDPKSMGSALMFGLDFDSLALGEDIEDPQAAAMLEQLKPSFEKIMESFKTDCEYDGTRDVEGKQMGVIKLKIVADGSLDMTQAIDELARGQIPEGMEFELTLNTAKIGMKMKGEGELLWDMAAGLPAGFTLTGDREMNFELDAAVSAEGEEHSIEMNVEMMGKMDWTME